MDEKLRREIHAILHSDGKLAALAALRSRTGMDLGEAKAVIEAMLEPSTGPDLAKPGGAMDEKLREELRVILRKNGKVAAVAALRTRTGAGVAAASAIVDELMPAASALRLPTKLLDLAADFVITSRSSAERARIEEQAIGHWGKAPWEAGVARGRELTKYSYELCDRARSGEFSVKEVEERLRDACPGFGEDAYSSAFQRGMLDSHDLAGDLWSLHDLIHHSAVGTHRRAAGSG
jgi:ribosomal protein L7/L12